MADSAKMEVIARDQGRCRYCGCQTGSGYGEDNLTIDHVLPRSRGGKDHVGNMVVACFRCNHRKGSRTPTEAGMDLLAAGTLVVFPRNRRAPLSDRQAPSGA